MRNAADVVMCAVVVRSLNVKETLENDPEAYYNKEELVEPLLVMYNSLIETEDDSIANGRLLDVIRQVSAPGLVHSRNTSLTTGVLLSGKSGMGRY